VGKRFDIHLLVVSKTPAEDTANAHVLEPVCGRVEVFPADRLPANAREHGCSLPVLRHRAPAAGRRVAELLEAGAIDLVHVEGFYLMQHVPDWVEVPVLLVEQNVEYDLEYQRARAERDGVTRLDAFVRGAHTRRAELDCWSRATRLATVTEEDRDAVRGELAGIDVSVVPDGAEHIPAGGGGEDAAAAVPSGDGPRVVLLANFAYAPNVDAAHHLVQDILPAIAERVPDVRVWLVGNAPPEEVRAHAGEQVTVTGYVPDVLPHLDAADVVVCPLRIGGGVKLKTIEALRRGKAIVSTQVGAQGVTGEARRALVIADAPREFAAAVSELLLDAEERTRRARRTADAAHTLPSWDGSAATLASIYEDLLDQAAVKPDVLGVAAGSSL
jgi:glycosyltransferase involved in cell wall biosynthesis